MQQKTERFEMRFDPDTLKRVDAWRAEQPDFPPRAGAVRRLIETGLSNAEGKPLRFSHGEMLITVMLCEIYKHLKINGEISPAFIEKALHGGHYWGLEWEYTGIFHGHEDRERLVYEVGDILDMWSLLERSYAHLSKKDKGRIEKEASPFGKSVVFRGFDGNNEGEHLGIAGFMITELNRFSDFKDRDLNAHMPSLDGYRRMLSIFKPLRHTLAGHTGGTLSVEQIIQMLNAMGH